MDYIQLTILTIYWYKWYYLELIKVLVMHGTLKLCQEL